MEKLLNDAAVLKTVKNQTEEIASSYFKSLTVWWDINEFSEHCCAGRGRKWIKENILNPYKKEIDIKNGGFCRYSLGGKGGYQFIAKDAVKWMNEHVHQFDWG